MTRESSQGNPTNSEIKELADQLIYVPTTAERKLKAKFWIRASENPLAAISGNNITVRQIKDLSGAGSSIDASWKKPGFKDWFLNTNEGQAKLEYLFDLGLDALEGLLLNTDPKTSSAKVNAVKLLAELTGRASKAKQPAGLGDAIAHADKASLEALFESAGLKIALSASKGDPSNDTINVTPESK